MIQNAEIGVDDQNNLEISINEFNKFKIFSTRSKNRVISVISDNRIQLGLVRMLLRQYY